MKMTTTNLTGAFAVPSCIGDAAAGYRERRTTGLVGSVAPGSTSVASASRSASAWKPADVSTPEPVRLGGVYG